MAKEIKKEIIEFLKNRKTFLVQVNGTKSEIITSVDLQSAITLAHDISSDDCDDDITCMELPMGMMFDGKSLFEHMHEIALPIDQKIIELF